MLSRRLLRVKVMQMVYAHYQKGDSSIDLAEKELFHSVAKSHEMYNALLLLLLELKGFADKRIELRKDKKRPSEEDLNPNTRFVNNAFLLQLADNENLESSIRKNGAFWSNYPEVVKGLFTVVEESKLYIDYMAAETSSYAEDQRFIAKLMEKVIAPHEPLYALFEEESVYWNDESEFIISMVVKTIKGFSQENGTLEELLPEFKDEEDIEFLKRLCRKALINKVEYMDLIKKYTKNWDFDRVAFLDIVLMQIAIAEVVEFKNIPINVSLNEYIEIAKYYSTSKSGIFINGILDKIVEQLVADKKVMKLIPQPIKD